MKLSSSLKIYSLYLIFFLFKQIHPMFITIQPKDSQCIYQEKQKTETFSVIYYISGEEEERNIVRIHDPKGEKIWEITSKSSSTFTTVAQMTGKYSFCIDNLSMGVFTVTFEFTEENKNKELITVQTIDNFQNALENINKKLDVMQFGIRSGAVRREKHSTITQSIQSKITWYTWVKVIFLILFSFFQIVMITSIFKNVKVVSKIEMGHSNKGGKDKDNEGTEFL